MGYKRIFSPPRSRLSSDPKTRDRARRFRKVLLKWAICHGREFPWRTTSDAYKTLMAEVMLQRTRSYQVVDVYQRFIQKYPSIAALAETPTTELARLLRPLGLVFRARSLSALAR